MYPDFNCVFYILLSKIVPAVPESGLEYVTSVKSSIFSAKLQRSGQVIREVGGFAF